MKRISTYFTAVNVAVFFVVISVFALLATVQTMRFIQTDTRQLLTEWTTAWGDRIEKDFGEVFARTDVFKSYVEETLTFPTMADPKKLLPYFMGMEPLAAGLIKRYNTLDYYLWLAPEYTDPSLRQFTFQNMKLDRTVQYKYNGKYTRAEMSDPSWDWFTLAEKNGKAITDPYGWEGFDGKIVSLTQSIVLDGKPVGVVGVDIFVTSLEEAFTAERILDTGYYTLVNQAGTVLFGPDQGKSLKDLGVLNERIFEAMPSIEADSGILQLKGTGGEQLVGYRVLSNGWRLFGVPAMAEIYRPITRLITLMLILSVISLAILAGLSMLVARTLSRPIEAMSGIQERIASGLLDTQVPGSLVARADELGSLSRATKSMIETLGGIINKTVISSKAVQTGSDEITGASSQVSTGASEQASSMEEVASAMEQMAANIRQNSDNARETYSIAQKTASDAKNGGEMVAKSVEAIRTISQKISIIEEISRNTSYNFV